MNPTKSFSLTPNQKQYAYELSDEIFNVLRCARMASFAAGEMMEGYFGKTMDGSPSCSQRLVIEYQRAANQLDILLDYLFPVVNALEELNTAATEYGRKMEVPAAKPGTMGESDIVEAIDILLTLPAEKRSGALAVLKLVAESEKTVSSKQLLEALAK